MSETQKIAEQLGVRVAATVIEHLFNRLTDPNLASPEELAHELVLGVAKAVSTVAATLIVANADLAKRVAVLELATAPTIRSGNGG
jgi:hypothetical protein